MIDEKNTVAADEAVIFFDGLCNLCNASVQFILKRDPKAYFRFASLQSPYAQQLFNMHGVDPRKHDSIVLFEKGKFYFRSTAALSVARKLKGLWPFLYFFMIVPGPVRNAVYDWIARHRYRWFGKRESCMLPEPKWQERFLD